MSHPDLLEDRLTHLPPRKRRELAFIAKILFEEFQQAQSTKTQKIRRNGKIVKLVLFGSHARGDWVEDPKGNYFSDFDLLVVVSGDAFTDFEFWEDAEDRLDREHIVTRRIKTPIGLIVHSYADVNGKLAMGWPFFLDIVRDGIVLYEAEGYPFAKPNPKNMTDEEKYAEGQRYFEAGYPLSLSTLKLAKIASKDSKGIMDADMRTAAFLAHQATEHIYICLLLTCTLYSPKEHNIKKLRAYANAIAPELEEIWPQDKKFYKRSFERLRRAYVEARYSLKYEITKEELEWLFERIALLQQKVKEICEAHLQKIAPEQKGK